MLRYEPGETLGHTLDPRAKLVFQSGFAVAAFAHTTPRGLAVLTGVVAFVLLACRLAPQTVVDEFGAVVPFLLAGPVIEALTLGSPWIVPGDAVAPTLAAYRTLLLLALATAYVRTTPVRESEAAVAWFVPGRVGRYLGVGTALVFRFLPVLQADVDRIRDAMRARLGTERPVRDRVRLVALGSLQRAFRRADRLSLALRARCFAWNPTPPSLAFGPCDVAATAAGGLLAATFFL